MPHGRVSGCMKKANKLMSIVSGHKGTSPTFETVAMVMRLRKDVEGNQDVLHHKTSRTIVDKALSKSKEFLDRLSDVDGILRCSKASCFGLAGRILDFVGRHGGAPVSPEQVRKIERMREALMSKTSSMKDAWDELIQCSIDYDDTRRCFTRYWASCGPRRMSWIRPCLHLRIFYGPCNAGAAMWTTARATQSIMS